MFTKLKSFLLKTFKTISIFLFSILLILAFSEAYYRVYEEYSHNKDFLKIHAYRFYRLFVMWNGEKKSLLEPPFNAITNVGWNDPKRLEQVYKYSHLPPNFKEVGVDFLKTAPLKYRVSINSMGYRNPEINPKKEKNEKRILALGSYMTFGHGVNDEDTFTAVAEKSLNEKQNKYKYTFINGGLQCGTLILGLSRLHKDFDTIKPDYVIFEYGFTDPLIEHKDSIADDFSKLAGLPENEHDKLHRYSDTLMWIERNPVTKQIIKIFSQTYLYQKMLLKISDHRVLKSNIGIDLYLEALTKTTKNLTQKGVKVIWLHHPLLHHFRDERIDRLAEESGAKIIRSYDYFLQNPPSEKDWSEFENDKENFLAEVGISRDAKQNISSYRIYGPYMQNVYQLSPKGQAVVGQAIVDYFDKPADEKLK